MGLNINLQKLACVAIDRQLAAAAVDSMLASRTPRATSTLIASLVGRHENTRVIMALVQAADQEPTLREMFHEFADRIVHRAGKLLENLKPALTEEHRGPGEWFLTSQPSRAIDAVRNRAFLLVSARLP
jgi:hypothetical protein